MKIEIHYQRVRAVSTADTPECANFLVILELVWQNDLVGKIRGLQRGKEGCVWPVPVPHGVASGVRHEQPNGLVKSRFQ
jgi:hypothetical protein